MVMATPINPSDLYCMKGLYDDFDLFKVEYPSVPGWEGAGVVVQSGGGLMAWKVMGRRIAFSRKVVNNEFGTGGCFQQYVIIDPMACNYIPDDMPFSIGCMNIVNPITSIGLYDKIVSTGAVCGI